MQREARDLGGGRRSRAVGNMGGCSGSCVPKGLPNNGHQTGHTNPARGAASIKQADGQNVRLWHLAEMAVSRTSNYATCSFPFQPTRLAQYDTLFEPPGVP